MLTGDLRWQFGWLRGFSSQSWPPTKVGADVHLVIFIPCIYLYASASPVPDLCRYKDAYLSMPYPLYSFLNL